MSDPKTPAERKYFGTDGIRGTANVHPMTCEVALALGRAVAHQAKHGDHRHRIVIGKDTRVSGYMVEMAFASGVCSMGVDDCEGQPPNVSGWGESGDALAVKPPQHFGVGQV